MSYSKQINELRANNWRTLSSLTAQSSELGRLEAAQHTDTAKLWGLLGEKGTKAISALHAIHQENRIAQAHSDFMMFRMQQYLASDEAKAASADLLNGETVNRQFETALADKAKEMPYDMITKANKLGGVYRATLHRLHLGQTAERYPAEMRSMMLKSDEMIDWVDPADGQTKSFKINEASSLGERMAAHNYLRNRYFSTHGVTSNGYTQAFLALSPEQGGSGFYQAIMAHETGKDGMFAQYQKQSDIEASFEDQMTMYMAFLANPSGETFGQYYRTVAMGVNEKGNKYGHAGAHKKVREQLKVLAETNQLKFNQIQQIQEAKFNINGVDMTAKELWPKYFGENGELSRSYMKGVRKGSEETLTAQQIMFEADREDVINRMKNNKIATQEQVDKEVAALKSKFKGQDYDYEPIYAYWRNSPFITSEETESRVKALQEKSKQNILITKSLVFENNAVKEDDRIQKIVSEEKAYLEEALTKDVVESLLEGFEGAYITEMGLPSWKTGTQEAQIAFDHKLGIYLGYIKNEGLTPQKAALATQDEWDRLSGLDEDWNKKNGKQRSDALFYQDTDGGFPNFMKQYLAKGKERTIYSAYRTAKEIRRTSGKKYFPKEDKIIKTKYNGNAIEAFSKIDNRFEAPSPAISLDFEATEFTDGIVDYNKKLEDTGQVPIDAMLLAREQGISVVDFVNARQKAYGKPEISPEFMEELGDSKELHTLDSAIRKAIFSSDTDGYIEVGAEIAKGTENPTESYEQTTGDIAFGEITESIFGPQGSGDAYSYKFHANLPIALAASFSPAFDLDFTEGGRELFIEQFAQMSPEDKMNLVWSNPNIGEKMFDLTGDLKTYPLVPGLQGSQFDIDNQNAVYTAISQNAPTYDTGEDFTTNQNLGIAETTTQPEEQTEVTPEVIPEVTPEVVPEKKEVSLKQAKKIAKGIETHPVFDNWPDSGLDTKSQLIARVEIALLNALNGDISDIDPELLDWVQPFLEQFNIDNTITE